MIRLLRLLFTADALDKIDHQYSEYIRHGSSVYAARLTTLYVIIGWIFLRWESPSWQRIFSNRSYWFPHIYAKKPRVGDLLRYVLQSVWLFCSLSTPPKKSLPNLRYSYYGLLNAYYGKIAKIPEKVERNTAARKTMRRFMYTNRFIKGFFFLISSLFATAFMLICITQPFKPQAQLIFVIILWAMAMSIRRIPGMVCTILLVVVSFLVSCRYIWWRYNYTLVWDDTISFIFGVLLIIAESYIWLVMVLGYFQTIWPLHRQPVSLPDDYSLWPTVDIMIATYNEDLSVLRSGVYSALGLDWPKEKLNIYILDDGNRPEVRQFAEDCQVNYIARPTHEHAKAGNINYALKYTHGELVAIFDCDFIISYPFLQLTVGWFLKDPNLAILQTPHHFFSPDPFERNLSSFRKTPNESALFYGVVQDGNDTWNAAYFCGSAGIMRRSALEKIGGMAVESVTEDAHTSLRLQRMGYNSAYIRIPLAAGLATETLAGHVGQRIRWARGMVQAFRIDNPLFGKGLALGQRLCYFNAMLHFLSGIPRLIFFITPASFLLFNARIVYASSAMVLLYAIPHIVHAVLANDRIQGKYRHFLWNEIYETVMAWYIALPTTIALINPRKGKFNVTSKGDTIDKKHMDWQIARPYTTLLLINLTGLAAGILRIPFASPVETLALCITLTWVSYNIIILGGALGVSIEAKQIRKSQRVSFVMPGAIVRKDGHAFRCLVKNYSDNGLGIEMPQNDFLGKGDEVMLLLHHGQNESAFPCSVTHVSHLSAGIELSDLSLRQHIDYIQCTFARADTWAEWQNDFPLDKPLKSMREVFIMDLKGYWSLLNYVPPKIHAILSGITYTVPWIGSFLPHKPGSQSVDLTRTYG